ncbi:MAG: 2-oxo-4-hydroxy-4-carboxy-5-ureidoimidazoline decarboxylase [Pseudolabrys sp.]
MSETPTTLDVLNAAGTTAFVAAMGAIYEHSPWVAEAVAGRRPFASLAALHEAMRTVLMMADEARKRALLNAHPDLAGKAALAGALTADSKIEQHSVGLDRLNAAELAALHSLNAAYREKFGFPFIICVRRHTKDSIFRQFERRLNNDLKAEYETALTEVSRIAALRLDQHVSASDRLQVHGRLSTHVLDTYHGRPAPGVAIELHELSSSGEGHLVTRATTNADGRTAAPLIGGRPLPIGRYELRFAIGDYFKNEAELPDPPFLDVVPIRFAIADAEGHYHVPLVMTPWSYATYRGS